MPNGGLDLCGAEEERAGRKKIRVRVSLFFLDERSCEEGENITYSLQ